TSIDAARTIAANGRTHRAGAGGPRAHRTRGGPGDLRAGDDRVAPAASLRRHALLRVAACARTCDVHRRRPGAVLADAGRNVGTSALADVACGDAHVHVGLDAAARRRGARADFFAVPLLRVIHARASAGRLAHAADRPDGGR